VFSPARVAAVTLAIPMPPLAKSVAPLMVAQASALAAAAPPVETSPPLAFAADGQPGFYDLFRTEGRGGVSQAVSELWGVRAASAPPPSAAVVPASGVDEGRGRGFDLFRSPRT
jgi:hypothetical protein